MSAFTFVDLFAGVGGFHHALSAPGFDGECVMACDIDEKCRTVYARTWPQLAARGALLGDIRTVTQTVDGQDRPLAEVDRMVPDHDVLCAGFPCQPFSKSGAQLGVSDRTRGTLFFDILTVVDAKRPKFLILENVRNLAGPRHVETWKVIIASLRQRGYRVSDQPVVLSPHLLHPDLGGRPQSRDRVFILATRVSEPGDLPERDQASALKEEPLAVRAPTPGWHPSLWDVEQFLDDDIDIPNLRDYQLRDQERYWIRAWQAFAQGMPGESLPGFPIWVDEFKRTRVPEGTEAWKRDFFKKNMDFYRGSAERRTFIDWWLRQSWSDSRTAPYRVGDFPASRRKFEWQARSVQPTQAERDLTSLTLHLRPSGLRVKPATYLPALVAITQTSIIGSRMRRITPVEAARLQGLPDEVYRGGPVSDATAYKQVGNGVNVGVVQYVARRLFAASQVSWGAGAAGEEPGEAA